MSGFLADLKHAIRIYLSTPASSLLAVAVLAIAMACVSALLSLFSDLVLKSHPGFERSRELITIGRNQGTAFTRVSMRFIERTREEIAPLHSITGIGPFALSLEPGGDDMQIEYVARGFAETMRPHLALGRDFDDADHDEGAEPVAVISYEYWREEFGGRPDAVGQTIRVRGTPFLAPYAEDSDGSPPKEQTVDYRIVGVMAESYAATFAGSTALWLPAEQAGPIFLGPTSLIARLNLLYAIGRIDDSASVNGIVTELRARLADDMAQELGLGNGVRLDAMRGITRDVNVKRDAERQVRLLLAGGVLLALVAAANVSLFLLSRAPGRRRELGVRMSVGAPTRRLARQLATEAGLLVLVSAALGILIGAWLSVGLENLSFLRGTDWRDVSMDWRVIGIVAGMSLLLTALVSLGPVVGLRRLGLAASSRTVTARPGLTQHVAGNVQIAVACILTGVAGAFVWYLSELLTENHGYTTDGLDVVSLAQPQGFIALDDIDFDSLLAERARRREAVLALPGIEAVAFGTSVPGHMGNPISGQWDIEETGESIQFTIVSCDPAYIELLGMRLVDGQPLTEADRGALLVNETFARALWGRTDVAGEVLPGGFTEGEQTEIVGVVEDVSFRHPAADAEPLVFASRTPWSGRESLLIRSPLSPAELRTTLQGAIDSGAIEIEIEAVETMSSIARELIAADRARSTVAVATALLVVALAAFGFYGTQRFLVAAGRREFAIRAALGAGPRAIGRLVLGRALLLGTPGLAFGSLLAFIAVASMRPDFVPETVSPAAVTLAVLVAMALLLLASTLGPAKLARDTDPGPLLKQD